MIFRFSAIKNKTIFDFEYKSELICKENHHTSITRPCEHVDVPTANVPSYGVTSEELKWLSASYKAHVRKIFDTMLTVIPTSEASSVGLFEFICSCWSISSSA
ncbi:hypothetical protein TNCV_555981 [Trichonephila clavipes]|uniref:Uncharacterized protein n=1 Tax=Trichonephila clavipes TaxID=2585209 RepID=A0A8X6V2S4_TRICX|nr:hypothetical protein TNCV_555981 [Trichonephila clavipes]